MPSPKRGEVWIVDLGLAAKIRPCLVLSVPVADTDRALATLVAHTTSPCGTAFEVESHARFLKPGVFDAQNLVTVPTAKLVRRVGVLPANQLELVEQAVRRWLGLPWQPVEKSPQRKRGAVDCVRILVKSTPR